MKSVVRISAAMFLLLVLLWIAFGDALRPRAVTTATLGLGEGVAAVYGSGTAEPVRVLTIRAPASGIWTNVSVDDGSVIAVEQMVGQIEVAGLQEDLERAEIDLAAAEDREEAVPGVRALRAESAAVDARIELTELEIDRVDGLVDRGIESVQTLDRLRAELEELESQQDALRARRRDAEQGVELDTERQRVLVRQARQLLERTYLRAPLDGLVLERLVEPGEWVQQGAPLLRIADVSELVVEAEIDESDVQRVELGSEALVSFYALEGAPIAATVVEIATDANRDRGTFDVVLQLDVATERLRPGLSAEVNIITHRSPNALLVPNAALDGGVVWVVVDGRARPREPELGIRGATHAEVLSGLESDEVVILRPPPGLSDGQRVRVVESE